MQIGNLTLRKVHTAPNIFVVDDFFSASELEHLDQWTQKGRFSKSFVDQVDSQESLYDGQHRTSTFLSFAKQQDAKIAAIEQKASALLGCWSTQSVEPLQLVRYLPGQFFGVHHDMGDLNDDGSVELPAKTTFVKRRLATIFGYLNDVDKGGATYFPACGGLRVEPKRGRAVLFSNVLPNGLPDPRTIHAGEPVQEGLKHGLNIWYTES